MDRLLYYRSNMTTMLNEWLLKGIFDVFLENLTYLPSRENELHGCHFDLWENCSLCWPVSELHRFTRLCRNQHKTWCYTQTLKRNIQHDKIFKVKWKVFNLNCSPCKSCLKECWYFFFLLFAVASARRKGLF